MSTIPVAPEPEAAELGSQAAVAPPPNQPSLKARTVRASAWTIVGYGATQVVRFGSSVALTHMLAPDVLGTMVIVNTIVLGFQMFSDLGIGPCVVQNPAGDERRFQNTAWTVQVLRGIGLWLAVVLAAWPMSRFYDSPQLLSVLPTVALSALIMGFNSTALFTLQRHLSMARVMALDVVSLAFTLGLTIAWAAASPTIWALVFPMLIGTLLKTILTHVVLPGGGNWFDWEPRARHALSRFGRWIFLSTAVTFVSMQSDRLILGKLVDEAGLQVYSIALNLSEMVPLVVTTLVHSVLFAAFSRVAPEGNGRLRHVYYRSRLKLDLLAMIPLGGLCAAAGWVVHFFYPETYEDAAWIVPLLAIRAAMSCALVPAETVLFSLGKAKYAFWRNVGRAIWVLAGVPLGWHLAGLSGVVVAVMTSEIPVVLVLWPAVIRHGLFSVLGELRAVGLFGLGLAAGQVFVWLAPDLTLRMLFQWR